MRCIKGNEMEGRGGYVWFEEDKISKINRYYDHHRYYHC